MLLSKSMLLYYTVTRYLSHPRVDKLVHCIYMYYTCALFVDFLNYFFFHYRQLVFPLLITTLLLKGSLVSLSQR